MGGLPFLVAHVDMVVAGRAPPVDAGHVLTLDIGAELPEILADAAPAPAVPAGDDGVDDAPGFDQQVGHQRGALARAGQCVCGDDPAGSLADTGHQPAALTSRATTSRTLMPSARAAKVSAMRCWSTGSASVRTSSTDGASRPS